MNQTALIHHRYAPPAGFNGPQIAVYKASTVFFDRVAAMRTHDWKSKDGYSYGLHGTPTTFTLEARIASLEGGSHCLLTPSGLASIACVNIALLKTGDEVLIPSNCYAPSLAMAQNELANWGITHQTYDAMNPADLAAKLSSRTKLVWMEAAGSVTMEFPDLAALSKLCREQGVITTLDNTWGAGLAFNAFEYVDITVHALTKYPSGSANLLMGSVVTKSEALYQKIKFSHMHVGWGVGANDVEQVLLGLNTIHLRYAAQDQTARALAFYLGTCPEIAQVLHPATEGALGHEAWRRICTGSDGVARAAGNFSVIFQSEFTQDAVDRFCEALSLFRLGYSWAGPISLVVPYELSAMRPNWPTGIARGCLVRFCIGLEHVTELQADLVQALRTLYASDL